MYLKGIVHFEINVWHVLSYLKGIQDVGVSVSAVVSILIFWVNTDSGFKHLRLAPFFSKTLFRHSQVILSEYR